MHRYVLAAFAVFALGGLVAAEEITMVSGVSLSPDGARLAFSWRGDLWTVPLEGGVAERLTSHPATDSSPMFSPDGTEIAFVSDRFPGGQVFVMPAVGGEPAQITFDTNGFGLEGWYPDGKSLLVRGVSDRFWVEYRRFYRVRRDRRAAPEMLFDATGHSSSLSADGRRVLFVREGVAWWRKGYTGSQAGQIWAYHPGTGLTRVIAEETGSRWPRWLPGGRSFLYVGAETGSFNLMRYDLDTGVKSSLTRFTDDSVVAPAVSADGSVVVFRHLFHLYRLRPGVDEVPVRIEISVHEDSATDAGERLSIRRATEAAFTEDGLEIAVAAGGDLFVMDTVLREPVRVTESPEEERDFLFTPDGAALFFVSDRGEQSDIWKAERADADRYWWQNREFTLTRVTESAARENGLSVSPDGTRLAYRRGRGELVVSGIDGKEPRVLVSSHSVGGYAWSPDGRYVAYSSEDPNSNRDIWIVPADGSAPAANVSRHPFDDWGPAWSPDGKILAFVGERREREADIHYVWLDPTAEEETARDRALEKAIETMKKVRKEKPAPKEAPPAGAPSEPEAAPAEEAPPPSLPLDGLWERVRRISIANSGEGPPFWSPDGRKLAFTATVAGKRGVYTVEFPDKLTPALLTTTAGDAPAWTKVSGKILWLVGGVPTASAGPKNTSFPFTALIERDRAAHQRVAFDLSWQTMRDWFYDARMNNRNWDEIRRKYRDMAASAPDRSTFGRIVSLMLGELNASHLGFSALGDPYYGRRDQWTVSTAHLGVRLDPSFKGPGWSIADVVPLGPADREASRLEPGEVILTVDGTPVDPDLDPTLVLNVEPGHQFELGVRNAAGEERIVALRPTGAGTVRGLLYRAWIENTRAEVVRQSGGKLGYLHIRGMNWSSFEEFQRDIHAAGYGRDGLVIDVRYNGGGFTADHLLTALTAPEHAFAVERGAASPGYPQDRRVYATWTRPIVVLANQDSFSNAEIFAHAIKTLGRGKLVGVRTAGGVISTSGRRILDLGTLRIPLRGWFLLDTGEDMERNGAIPDFEIWPLPGEMATGVDRQLEKAVEVLLGDVAAEAAKPRVTPKYASER